MNRNEARVGMKVYFGRANGEKTLGEIVKINSKNLKVKTLEGRGTQRSYRVGSVWTVPPALCTPADEGRPSHITRRPDPVPTRTNRTEREIMKEIDNVYCGLSPENLHCDGEISRSAAMVKYRRYQKQLRALFNELGREVSEWECVEYFRSQRAY